MKKRKTKVYLVNHTHWDREWYFSEQDSLILSDVLFANVFKELSKNRDAVFVLDGQASILEEYLRIHPEKEKIVKKLNENGQLKIGPWYTQTDALHVQGESILRNGIIGNITSKRIGTPMKIGYLPDTFGFNAQMPMILNHLGLHNFIFWRGINLKKTKGTYFHWFGQKNNAEVLAANMPQGYSTGMMLEPTHNYVDGRLDKGVDFIQRHSNKKYHHVLIPVGNDQMDIVKNIGKKVERINKLGKYSYKATSYEDFLNKIVKEKLPDYRGEFFDPILARIHRTCGSNRIDTKIASTNLEEKLINQVEPLLVLADRYGLNLSNGAVINAWKKLLRSQAHDSMAGSVVDSVNNDILHRLKEANELADGLINTVEKLLSLKLGINDQSLLLLNPYVYKIDEYQKVKILSHFKNIKFDNTVEDVVRLSSKKIPGRDHVLKETSHGDEYISEPAYFENTYLLKTKIDPLSVKVIKFNKGIEGYNLKEEKDKKIGNNNFKISFNDNHLFYKDSIHKAKDFIYLIDQANDGDTYDFSPLANGYQLKLNFQKCHVFAHQDVQIMKLSGQSKVPKDLFSWEKHDKNKKLNYSMTLKLIDDVIQINFKVRNNVKDHNLCLVIDTNLNMDKSIASIPYGYLERKKQNCFNWQENFVEKPVSVWPLENNVSVIGNKKVFTLFSKNVCQYSIRQGKIILPLLNATGQLGKSNLVNRPGRASGDTDKIGHNKISTPLAEVQKDLNYKFALTIEDQFSELKIQKTEEKLKFVPLSYQLQKINLFNNRLDNKLQDDLVKKVGLDLPTAFIPLSLPNNIGISACYLSYFTEGNYILRIFNPSSFKIKFKLPEKITTVNALEEEVKYNGYLDPYSVVSLKLPIQK